MQLITLNKIKDIDLLSLVKLDKKLIDKYGLIFSGETWDEDNFLYDLPSKHKYTFILKLYGEVRGYCVASEKMGAIYIHRFAVDACYTGISESFFRELLSKYKKREIYLMVNVLNEVAIRFYKKFNFVIENDGLLINKMVSSKLKIKNNLIILEDDYKCYLMRRK